MQGGRTRLSKSERPLSTQRARRPEHRGHREEPTALSRGSDVVLLANCGDWSTIPAAMGKRKAKKAARRGSKRATAANHLKLPKSGVTLVVLMRARAGHEPFLEAELRALVTPTRKEEGCLQYDLHRAADGTGAFLVHEVWESRERHTAHTKTDHFLRWNARKDALLASREATFWTQIV